MNNLIHGGFVFFNDGIDLVCIQTIEIIDVILVDAAPFFVFLKVVDNEIIKFLAFILG
ncbi:MAG: hypothetical protein HUJ16_01090 [Kangiella sp.]|nr:hypothetical protein [Kangiella sp.]